MRNALIRPTSWAFPSLFDGILNDWPLQSPGPRAGQALAAPALNVWEQDDRLFVEVDVPGFRMEELSVLLDDDILTLEGRRASVRDADVTPEGETPVDAKVAERADEAADTRRFLVRESGREEFARAIRLPFAVNADEVTARLDAGVLHIELPKADQERRRQIEVRSA